MLYKNRYGVSASYSYQYGYGFIPIPEDSNWYCYGKFLPIFTDINDADTDTGSVSINYSDILPTFIRIQGNEYRYTNIKTGLWVLLIPIPIPIQLANTDMNTNITYWY